MKQNIDVIRTRMKLIGIGFAACVVYLFYKGYNETVAYIAAGLFFGLVYSVVYQKRIALKKRTL